MKVKFRTVQGKTFELEFEDDTKVGGGAPPSGLLAHRRQLHDRGR